MVMWSLSCDRCPPVLSVILRILSAYTQASRMFLHKQVANGNGLPSFQVTGKVSIFHVASHLRVPVLRYVFFLLLPGAVWHVYFPFAFRTLSSRSRSTRRQSFSGAR